MTSPVIENTEPAPYGRRLDGTPRRKPGRPPGARNKVQRGGARRASGTATGSSPYRQTVVTDGGPADELPPAEVPFPGDESAGTGGPDGAGLLADPVSAIGAGLEAAAGAARASRRPTAAVQKDIRAKVAFMMMMPARLWSLTDPYCGQVAKESVPDVSDALADILCDSPDLVRWLTSGGNYLKYLTLVTRLEALGVAVWRHHIAHSVGDPHAGNPNSGFDPRQYPSAVPASA